ncbi:hypothetical protein MAPG_09162, partial [Magnaporthiopsis poae ATCC 64411]|uniref:Uncharacterized protein n=1 Tax=Magnaporthiopsis poae (strain ATCC 64411 / 73-15) TaxID=644358 RepID=A0A0C4E983_MAGP6
KGLILDPFGACDGWVQGPIGRWRTIRGGEARGRRRLGDTEMAVDSDAASLGPGTSGTSEVAYIYVQAERRHAKQLDRQTGRAPMHNRRQRGIPRPRPWWLSKAQQSRSELNFVPRTSPHWFSEINGRDTTVYTPLERGGWQRRLHVAASPLDSHSFRGGGWRSSRGPRTPGLATTTVWHIHGCFRVATSLQVLRVRDQDLDS